MSSEEAKTELLELKPKLKKWRLFSPFVKNKVLKNPHVIVGKRPGLIHPNIPKKFSMSIKEAVETKNMLTILSGHKKVGKSTELLFALKEKNFVFYIDFDERSNPLRHPFSFLLKSSSSNLPFGECLTHLYEVLRKEQSKMENPVVVFEHCEKVKDLYDFARSAYSLARYATVILVLTHGDAKQIKSNGGHISDRINYIVATPTGFESDDDAKNFMSFYPQFRKKLIDDSLVKLVVENCDACKDLDFIHELWNSGSKVESLLELVKEKLDIYIQYDVDGDRSRKDQRKICELLGRVSKQYEKEKRDKPIAIEFCLAYCRISGIQKLAQGLINDDFAHVVSYGKWLERILFTKLIASAIASRKPHEWRNLPKELKERHDDG
eukprot:TRINITY_DN3103_c0_g1_i1.p1 TRINITY_DN3103_c0_g1~~TRINITY_DN3103_c0_g1_i1.p1  ORF type:complete len:380 (-),score=65.03 TRINITY_DN3103_c0_g1_i1:320-1459(-)